MIGLRSDKNHLGTLFALLFGRAWDQMGQKCQYLAKNANIGPKILILTGGSKIFGTQITEKPPRHLARIVYWSGMGPNGPKMPIFGQKKPILGQFGHLWAKNPNFYVSK